MINKSTANLWRIIQEEKMADATKNFSNADLPVLRIGRPIQGERHWRNSLTCDQVAKEMERKPSLPS